MPGLPLSSRLVVSHDDFVMRHHRVHGVSVLPGVALLDVVLRALVARGIAFEAAVIRDVLFTEPVATGDDGLDREVRVQVGQVRPTGAEVTVVSRPSRAGEPVGPWRPNLTARLFLDDPADRRVNPAALFASTSEDRDMRRLYEQARSEDIVHGPPMRASGAIRLGGGALVADLSLHESTMAHANLFHMHPALLDASTLVAFARTPVLDAPFIPISIDEVRMPRPAGARCLVHVPQEESRAPSGDVMHNSYQAYDPESGALVAEFIRLTCKRIRRPDLITTLLPNGDGDSRAGVRVDERTNSLADVVSSRAAEPVVHAVADLDSVASAYAEHLRELVGQRLDRPAAEVAVARGFYEQGLDSVGMLAVSEDLQRVVGGRTYPTLLFEFGDIAELSRHLASTYGPPTVETAPAAEPSVAPNAARGDAPIDGEPEQATLELMVVSRCWRAEPLPAPAAERERGSLLLLATAASHGRAVADELRHCGHRVEVVDAGPDGTLLSADLLRHRVAALTVDDRPPVVCVVDHIAGVEPSAARPHDLVRRVAAAMVAARPTRRAPLLYVGTAGPHAQPRQAVAALVRTISAETPVIAGRSVVLDDDPDPARFAAVIDAETAGFGDDTAEVRYRAGRRETSYGQVVEPVARPTRLRTGAVCLITGGAGRLARILTAHLIDRYQARVVLAGRREPDADLVAEIARWRARGARVEYVRADVTNHADVEAASEHARLVYGRLHAVFHLAGAIDDALHFRKDPQRCSAVLAPKVDGLRAIERAMVEEPPELTVLFSSVSSVLANPGQSDYAFANAYLDHQAAAAPGSVLSISWPHWADGGMGAASSTPDAAGLASMPYEVGLKALDMALSSGGGHIVVAYGERTRLSRTLAVAGPPQAEPPDPPIEPVGDRGGPIAVIGVAGRYPGASDVDEFWRNLVAGRDSVTEVPATRWNHDELFDPRRGSPGRTYGRWGGFVDGVDRFAPGFFGISRREAEYMDPQERLFLTESWHALEDAGYPPEALAEQRVGVFAGVMWNHYQLLRDEHGVAPTALHSSVPNRVSYCFGFTGPSLAIDTACSSSLIAVHLAVESLRRGECDVALAGGVNVAPHPQKYLQLAADRFLSDDGRCRAFGAGGTGYVPGEGVGVVVLKPLARAIADGDTVAGVIAGSAVNHNGRTSGFTVPDPAAQASLIRMALTDAGLRGAQVTYVEAHGTGTSLGDPIEVEGLTRALSDPADMPVACAVGSVKSNVGHLESAAGVAGLTKVLLQLRHRELVASLHSTPPNAHIDFTRSGIRVVTEREEWTAPDGVLRAGVSAFGAGGTNAHLVVSEAPSPTIVSDFSTTRAAGTSPELVVLSAPDDATLERVAVRLREALTRSEEADGGAVGPDEARSEVAAQLGIAVEDVDPTATLADLGLQPAGLAALGRFTADGAPPDVDTAVGELGRRRAGGLLLADVAHTLRIGRRALRARAATMVSTVDELVRALGDIAGPNWWRGTAPEEPVEDPQAAGLLAAEGANDVAEVGRRWAAGVTVDWSAYRRGQRARRVSLPGTPLPEEHCWLGAWSARRDQSPAPTRLGEDIVELTVTDAGIAVVMMRDEANRNMFSDELLAGLQASFAELGARDDVRVVVLAGGPPVFSMGGEPEALAKLASKNGAFTDAAFVYEGLVRCPQPVIAAIGGHASGGGLAFGLYADLIVMSRSATYSANFLKYGFTPGMGATHILGYRFGSSLAAEMLLTCRGYAGEELERRGAQVRFADGPQVLSTALDLARSVAALPAGALRELKAELVRPIMDRQPEVIAAELAMHDRVLGEDAVRLVRHRLGGATPAPAPASMVVRVPARAAAPVPVTVVAPTSIPAPVEPEPELPTADRAAVVDVVEQALAAQLYLDRAELDPTRSFSDMGLDSIGAVDVVQQINSVFDTDIESVAVYDHPTLDRLTDLVLETVRAQRALVRAVVGGQRADEKAVAAPVSPNILEAAPPNMVELAPPTSASAPIVEAPPDSTMVDLAAPAAIFASISTVATAEPAPPTSAPDSEADHEIAIIAMSGQWPGARDLDEFWANLVGGRSAISAVAPDRWDVESLFDPDPTAPGRTYSRWAAMLDDVDVFDHRFFAMSPVEAAQTDPQQRLFLTEAWRALEQAGYAGDSAAQLRCGVFVGCAPGDYAELLHESGHADTAHAFLGGASSILAARISYLLDLRGPAVAVDTACSSSLVAVHLAAQSLRTGESDLALAGGVALMLTPSLQVRSSQVGMLSPTGTSAPFDAAADGIVLGEGVGVVLLKRLTDARRDGDRVLGVIKASGVNGDGRTNGITAPSADSQVALLRQVHARAGVRPCDITYVEAHGTGTALGDPIEFSALRRVLGGDGPQAADPWCALGSVKGNIGHTTLAAGVAGLIKVLLQLRHGELAPTAGYSTPNPKIDFAGSPLYPVTTHQRWLPGQSGTRIATVSSFGFSGTNCHLVVGQAPIDEHRSTSAPTRAQRTVAVPEVVVVSARTDAERAEVLAGLAGALTADMRVVDLSFTLAQGRRQLKERAAVVARDVDDLRVKLAALARGEHPEDCFIGTASTVVATAPTEPARDPRHAAQAYVRGQRLDWAAWFAGRAPRRVPLPGYPFARHRHWPAAAARPEPTDLPVDAEESEILTIRPTDRLVAEHVIAGRPLLPGAATAALVAAEVARVTGQTYPVRINGLRWRRPFPVEEVRRLRVGLTPSPTGGWAFQLADPAEPDAPHATGTVSQPPAATVERVDVAAMRRLCPSVVDVAGMYRDFDRADMRYGEAFRLLRAVAAGPDMAVADLAEPVTESVSTVLDGAFQSTAVLVGDETGPVLPVAIGSIHILGDLRRARHVVVRRVAELRFDSDITDPSGEVLAAVRGLTLFRVDRLEGKVFVPVWRDSVAAETRRAAGEVVVIARPTAQALAEEVVASCAATSAVVLPFGSRVPAGWAQLARTVDQVYVLALGDTGQPGQEHGVGLLLELVQQLIECGRSGDPVEITVVTDGAVATSEDEPVRPHSAALVGLTRTVAAEQPSWRVTCVDVAARAGQVSAADVVGLDGASRLVAVRDGVRLARSFVAAPPRPAASPFRRGVYLVVGGASGIGGVFSRHVARQAQATLVWLGRRPEDETIRRARAEIAELGGHAVYVSGDVSDPTAVAAALAEADRHGQLLGVVHSAGVLRDRRLANLTRSDVEQVLAPKVSGLVTLTAGLAGRVLDHMILFSSAASFIDADGQGNYAAACTFADAYALSLRQTGWPVTVVNWGYWGSIGLAGDESHRSMLAADGVGSLDPDLAMLALDGLVAAGVPQALVIEAAPAGLAHFGIGDRPAGSSPATPATAAGTVGAAVAVPPVSPAVEPAVAAAGAIRYVAEVFAEVLGHAVSDLDEQTTFDEFGVDSIVGIRLLDRMSQDLGPLPSTLLFEETTLRRLANRLVADRGGALAALQQSMVPVVGGSSLTDRPTLQLAEAVSPPGLTADEPIAIIGVDGRYPGANDLDGFWRNLRAGVSSITEVPADRWDWRGTVDPSRGLREYQRWGGFLDDVAGFDAALFGVLPKDAADIDPQERLFLQTCWSVLERAGYLGERCEPATGVFVGVMYGGYGELGAMGWAQGNPNGAYSAYWSIANRVSYTLDLNGPSMAVDTACSSSLTAVHLACESIRRGECRMALAGGVSLIVHPLHHIALGSRNMLAGDGSVKVFDATADGYVPGEGVGAVLLKPLRDAIADGDDVWGVIRGSALNAGGKTGGYTVPNPTAQAEVVAAAVRRSGVRPDHVGYVEAHGSGTELGDPIEVAGLARAFRLLGDAPSACAVGSVKANVGHLEGAAGIAGLTKVLLQLRHRTVAPTVALRNLNPKIDFTGASVRPQRDATEWQTPAPGANRVGCVSSFGAGGANAHIVVEEFTPASGQPTGWTHPVGEQLVLLSAPDASRLAELATSLADQLVAEPVPLAVLAFTSQTRRRAFKERVAVRCGDERSLVDALREYAAGGQARGLLRARDGESGEVDQALARGDVDALARMWVAGASVAWTRLWESRGVGRSVPRAALPPTPLRPVRLWVSGPTTVSHKGPDTVVEFERRVLTGRPLASTGAESIAELLIVGEPNSPVLTDLAERVRRSGGQAHLVGPGEAAEAAAELARVGSPPQALVYVDQSVFDPGHGMPGVGADDPDSAFRGVFDPVVALVRAGGRPRVLCVRVDDQAGTGGGERQPHLAAFVGLLRTVNAEAGAFGACVSCDDVDAAAEQILAELRHGTDDEVEYRGGQRFVASLVPHRPAPARPAWARPDGTYLITGGAGGLGPHFAELLVSRGAGQVVLIGRSTLTPAQRDRIDAMSRPGSEVRYLRADVTDPAAVAGVLDEARRVLPIRGVLHAAGVLRDARLVDKSMAQAAQVLAPKLTGTLTLDRATAADPLDFFVLFSSVAGSVGNPGQADYAYANAFLDAFARTRTGWAARGLRKGNTVSIGWPLWNDGGMSVSAAVVDRLRRQWGMVPMTAVTGLAAFETLLAGDEPAVVVVEKLLSSPHAEASRDPQQQAQPSGRPQPHPEVEVLKRLCQLAAEFLLVEPDDVDPHIELMDLGFDSISLTQLTERLNDEFGLDLLPTVVFEFPTLGDLAEHVRGVRPEPVRPPSLTSATPLTLAPADGVRAGDVAIIGLAGTMPGSADPEEFWRNLAAGRDLVRHIPEDREALLAEPRIRHLVGGFLDRVAEFDAALFGISRKEAALMDPQQRLFLQAVWSAIADAGYSTSALAGGRTGLFVGVSTHDYEDLMTAEGLPTQAHMATGLSHAVLANRVSHLLDLRGPSEAVDTACSSSLVALHRAVRALRCGECDTAVVGGVSVLLTPGLFTAFAESGMLSQHGRCATFDAAADGYVRGEGVGAFLLKPLAQALADDDNIYAVIRGSAVNHGGKAASLTAPHPRAQADVLAAAYADAEIDPATVTYVEAHGTGTKLGDPVEIEGMKKVFAGRTGEPLAIGSVKTNIGHLEAAAGVAGLLKVLLALRHRQVPPHLHLRRVNPHIRLDGSGLVINDRLTDWTTPVRRAGISSFGFGGTNAHVVVEQAPDRPDSTATGPLVFPLSAPDPERLAGYAGRLAEALTARPVALADVAHTLQAGRDSYPCRLAVHAADAAGLIAALRAAARGADAPGLVRPGSDVSAGSTDAALASAFVAGEEIDWPRHWTGRPRRVSLPTFGLAHTSFWYSDVVSAEPRPVAPTASAAPAAAVAESPTASEETVRTAIRAEVADLLALDPAGITDDQSLRDLGLDSIFTLDLAQRLTDTFGPGVDAAEVYDNDTVAALALLFGRLGAEVAGGQTVADGRVATPAPPPQADPGGQVVAKADLAGDPVIAAAVAELERSYGVESGLAGRDIAPMLFLPAGGGGYVEFAWSAKAALLWGFTGPESARTEVVDGFARHMIDLGRRVNVLSPVRLTELGGQPCTATPFGVVQHLPDLASFTIDGGPMRRLRSAMSRVSREPSVEVTEYRPGADADTDAAIVALVDHWSAGKAHVNRYVATVRADLARGALAPAHRLFLTRIKGTPVSAIVVTRMASEPGYLLDVEFYRKDLPQGGLDYSIVKIIELVRAEGARLFSFGATFGVAVGESDNASPAVASALARLRDKGVSGGGNYQFKSKFRPVEMPIYLCQPTSGASTVDEVLLMIAAPESKSESNPESKPDPTLVSEAPVTTTPAAEPVMPRSGPATALAAAGFNVLRLPADAIEVELLTDSWAERADPWIAQRQRTLLDLAAPGSDRLDRPWLPPHVVVASSGRAAEQLLCRAWTGPRGAVLHNGAFPTWVVALAENKFHPVPLAHTLEPSGGFAGDLPLAELDAALDTHAGRIAFVLIEPGSNASGGRPMSLANLRAIRERVRRAGLRLVLDAARLLDNVAAIVDLEPDQIGRDPWTVMAEMLSMADAVTLSLSKDFGVATGGLVAVSDPDLAQRLHADQARRGGQVSRLDRTLLAAALADERTVWDGVRQRRAATHMLWRRLADAGVPVGETAGGHCVLVDVSSLPDFAAGAAPVPGFLAWLFGVTGVRGGPHLAGVGAHPDLERCVRLAVPVGLGVEAARDLGDLIAKALAGPVTVTELVADDPRVAAPEATYRPVRHIGAAVGSGPAAAALGVADSPAGQPDWFRRQLTELGESLSQDRYAPADDNAAVVRAACPDVRRRLLSLPDGEVEVFLNGWSGSGPVVMLMHPFNIGAGMFAPQLAALVDRFRLLVVHQPGVGHTRVRSTLSLDGVAHLQCEVLDALGVTEPVHLGGASAGSIFAEYFAIRYPQRVRSLSMLGGSYKFANRKGRIDRLAQVVAEDFAAIAAGGVTVDPVRQDEVTQLLLRCESMDPHTGLRYLDLFTREPDLAGRLGEISVPALVVQGRHDSVVGVKTGHFLHGAIPDSRYVELAESGHFVCFTEAERVTQELTRFITDVQSG